MIYCPNCGKQFNDGALFCDGCGTQLGQTVACPVCGMQTGANTPFCQHCGAETSAKKPKKGISMGGMGEKLKTVPKKFLAIGVAVIALILAAAIVLPLVLAPKGSVSSKSVLVVQDEGLYFLSNGKADFKEVTSKYVDDEYVGSFMNMIKNTTVITPDGKRLFYTEKNDGSAAVDLYYKNPSKEKEDGTKIAADVTAFMINAKGTKIVYISDGKLYESDLEDKQKLASDVVNFYANDDLSVIYYETDEDIYRKESGKDKEKVSDDSCSIVAVSEDYKTVFYESQGNDLYKRTTGAKAVKIASEVRTRLFTKDLDVYALTEDGDLYVMKAGAKKSEKLDKDVYTVYYNVWESGEIYYLKSKDGEKGLMKYVEDDMKESDAKLQEPIEPEWPDSDAEEFQYPEWPDSDAEEFQYPDYPYSFQYDSDEEYQEAYAAYEEGRDKAQAAWEAAKDAYYEECDAVDERWKAAKEEYYELYDEYEEAYDIYREKEDRDELREELADYELSNNAYTLCFYNGKEVKEVIKNVTKNTATAADKPAVIVSVVNADDVKRIKLSEVDYAYEVAEAVRSALEESATSKIVIGTRTVNFDSEDKEDIRLSPDASCIYYLTEVSDEGEGELCKAKISDKKVEKAEKIDSDVSEYDILNGKLHYLVDVNDNGEGEYYVDGQKVAEDVYDGNFKTDGENDITYFFTDVDEDDECGTLHMYKNGKTTMIADEVTYFDIAGNGDIYMLCDYDTDKYEGTLYVYTGGKEAKEIAEDVTFVSSILTTEERLEQGLKRVSYYYGW